MHLSIDGSFTMLNFNSLNDYCILGDAPFLLLNVACYDKLLDLKNDFTSTTSASIVKLNYLFYINVGVGPPLVVLDPQLSWYQFSRWQHMLPRQTSMT